MSRVMLFSLLALATSDNSADAETLIASFS
jgi:hypothetical protein